MIYENNTNVGTAKVYLQGISSTLGGKKCIGTFAIKPAEIMSTTITVPESVAYDGSKTEASEYLKKSDIKVPGLRKLLDLQLNLKKLKN